jgi:hypothetical protein
MSDPDPQIEYYKIRIRKLNRTEIELKKERLSRHLPEYKACAFVLAEMDEAARLESLSVDRSAKNAGWIGVGLTALGIVIGIVVAPLLQKSKETPTPSQSLSDSISSSPSGVTPASHPSYKGDSATLPIPTKRAEPLSQPPLADPEPKKLPTPPTE